jgi:hypothetical protein
MESLNGVLCNRGLWGWQVLRADNSCGGDLSAERNQLNYTVCRNKFYTAVYVHRPCKCRTNL